MEATIEFKRHMAGDSIFGIIIYKLNYCQEVCSVILLPVHKSSEICFYCAILSLCLAINLSMQSCKESFLDT